MKAPHPPEVQEVDAVSETAQAPDASLMGHTLADYFGAKPVPVSAFFKAVRVSKIGRFPDDDVREADALMAAHDGDCRRLFALMSQPKRPDAVERWLWPVVQSRLKELVPGEFDPLNMDPASALRSLHRQLSGLLESKEPPKRRRAEILFTLGLNWLVSQRALDPWTALDEGRFAFFTGGKQVSAAVRRLLSRGKLAEVKNAAAIAGLAADLVQGARKSQDEETRRQLFLRSELDAAQGEIAALKGAAAKLANERDDFSSQADQAASLLRDRQQHWGHDMADIRAQQTRFLKERLGPLLNDAIDALEIEPAQPEIALNRLRSALASIQEVSK